MEYRLPSGIKDVFLINCDKNKNNTSIVYPCEHVIGRCIYCGLAIITTFPAAIKIPYWAKLSFPKVCPKFLVFDYVESIFTMQQNYKENY